MNGSTAKKSVIIRFTGLVEKMDGRFAWTYVEFPYDVHELFGKKGTVRVKGTINGTPMDRALMPTRSGVHFIVLGADLRKSAKVKVGDRVRIELWRNPRPDRIALPKELKETLDFFPEFKAAWEGLRPGMKRSILVWLNSGKTVQTRAKRVAEMMRRAETGHAWFRPVKKKQVHKD